jgi:hypothetical protein
MSARRPFLSAGLLASRKGAVAAAIAAAAFLSMLVPARSAAQAPILETTPSPVTDALQLRAEDAGGRSAVITLGYDAHASDGYDVELAEMPIPPIPSVQAFDFRFVDRSWLHRKPETGSYSDIRSPHRDAGVDTFLVRFQPQNDAWPARISWDEHTIQRFSSATLLLNKADGEERIDMKAKAFANIDASADPVLRVLLANTGTGNSSLSIQRNKARRTR